MIYKSNIMMMMMMMMVVKEDRTTKERHQSQHHEQIQALHDEHHISHVILKHATDVFLPWLHIEHTDCKSNRRRPRESQGVKFRTFDSNQIFLQ